MAKPTLSVRNRLILVALLPLTAVLPILLFIVFDWGNAYYDRLLIFKVNSDLAVAHQYFSQVVDRVGRDMQALANSQPFAVVLERGDRRILQDLLVRQRKELHLDFIRLLDGNGTLITSSLNADIVSGDDAWPVVRGAMNGQARTAIDVYSHEQLERLDPAFARQARLELVATANAAPDTRTAETRGMAIHNATPLLGADNRTRIILEGGILLNQNIDFVDTINSLVYTEGALPTGSHGTATLFLGDVRIATNVRLFSDQRALGTRVSEAVRGHVLNEGHTWRDRAFVVSDWYISAYEPIRDSFGNRVGMLYVGYLEEPFRKAKQNIVAAILLLFAGISAAGIYLSLRVARGIFQPLARMNRTMSAVEQGDTSARTGVLDGGDEIARLAGHLDELLDKLQAQNAELKRWGDELDAKVAERTQELEAANQKLRDTQRQLALSEKLAAIGEITAGVAHEINNPVAVIQGNLDLLRELLGPHAQGVAAEMHLIDQQIQRINIIVTKLLQFARPDEFAGYLEAVDCNDVISDCVVLVRHLLQQDRVTLERDSAATRPVTINRNELQQVLINLMVNAIHAMPDGGRLCVTTRDADKAVVIEVADSGIGIRKEDLGRIFDAFFSTKPQQGTGLGLSISYTIIARYGGSITVQSEEGHGSTFTVTLPTPAADSARASPPTATVVKPVRPAISGVVLAGGRGGRMGQVDKGLQVLNGKPLVQWVLERFVPQVGEVVISANQNLEQYSALGYATISDEIPGFAGPLAGLQAAMRVAAYPLVVSVPCDAPFLPADLVARLHAALSETHADVAVARTFAQAQPVFCLCRLELLPHLSNFLARGGRKFDAWYATLKVVEVAFDAATAQFANINTREDLARYAAAESAPPQSGS